MLLVAGIASASTQNVVPLTTVSSSCGLANGRTSWPFVVYRKSNTGAPGWSGNAIVSSLVSTTPPSFLMLGKHHKPGESALKATWVLKLFWWTTPLRSRVGAAKR